MNNTNFKTCTLKDVRVLTRGSWRNFGGHDDGVYNREGDRNFTISLDKDVAEQMIADGWDIRVREPKSDEYETEYTLKIRIKYRNRDGEPMPASLRPVVYFVTDGQRRVVDEEEVGALDQASISKANLVIRQYPWTYGKKTGVSTSLAIGYFYLEMTEFDDPFASDFLEDIEIPFDAE